MRRRSLLGPPLQPNFPSVFISAEARSRCRRHATQEGTANKKRPTMVVAVMSRQQVAAHAVNFVKVQPRGIRQEQGSQDEPRQAGASRGVKGGLLRNLQGRVGRRGADVGLAGAMASRQGWQGKEAEPQPCPQVGPLTLLKAAAATRAPTLPAAADMPWKKERTPVGYTCACWRAGGHML